MTVAHCIKSIHLSKGISKLPLDIDQFAVNLHSFFKLYSARREDYTKLQELTEVAAQYVLRHSSVQWLTMKYVVIRRVEQWSNLKEYFLRFIPKQKEFKRSIKGTKRYKSIVECLKDNMTLPYLSFTDFLAHQYETFLVTFQSEKPLIHMLFHRMTSLLTNLLENFDSKKSLYSYTDGSCKMKNVPDLVQLNLEKKENLKPSSFIDVGTKAKTIISDFVNECDKNKFDSSCQKCSIVAVSYLQNNLPFNNKIIEYSQYLHPQKRSCSASVSAISNLCLKIVKVFGSKAPKIFELPLDSTSDSIVDAVRNQWKMYQFEHITESMYMVENETRKNIPNSY